MAILLSLTTLAMLPIFLKSDSQTCAAPSQENREKSPQERDEDYAYCLKSKPCPHDGEQYSKLTEVEKKKAYFCRVKRHMECSTPPSEN